MNGSLIRRAAAVLLLAASAAASPGIAAPAPTVVQMATLAPGGAVSRRIYPGGVAGDEDAMIRKMRVGQIQAAAITGIGLAYLERSFYALHIPMMYASDEEFDYVRDRYAPVLERKLEEKGFIVLNWGDAGWVHFFSKSPVTTPAEAKALKIFMWSGDTHGGSPVGSLDGGHGDRDAGLGEDPGGAAAQAARGVPRRGTEAPRGDPAPEPGSDRGDGEERPQDPPGAPRGAGPVAEDGGGYPPPDPRENHAGGGLRRGEEIP